MSEEIAVAMAANTFDAAVGAIGFRILAAMQARQKITPQTNLRASGFWPCDRNLFYQVANWQDAAPTPPEKLPLFELGNQIEEIVIAYLKRAGYRLYQQQLTLQTQVRGGVITGHIDGLISGHELGDQPLPLEVKGYAFAADRFRDWHDFLRAPQPWLQQVPAQLQLYLYLNASERGVLLMMDKKGGDLYPLPVELDYDYCESLLQRAERVYEHLSRGVPPERIAYLASTCDHCRFMHLCQPLANIPIDETGEVFDEGLETAMEAYLQSAAAVRRHGEAENELKAFAKATGNGPRTFRIGEGEIELVHQKWLVKAKPAIMAGEQLRKVVYIRRRGESGDE